MLTFDDIVKKIQKQKHHCMSIFGKRLSVLTYDDIVKMTQKQKQCCPSVFVNRLSVLISDILK